MMNEAVVAVPAAGAMKQSIPARHERVGYEEYRMLKPQLDAIPVGVQIPLVIYMHGCTGIHIGIRLDFQLLFKHGFAVLAPDSFARSKKPMSCDAGRLIGGLHRQVLNFRLAEAYHVYRHALTLHWVDRDNIFLMGLSEGGIATARYPYGDLAGRVILGWTCTTGWWEYEGLAGPMDEPILSVVAVDDPWYTDPGLAGDCGDFMHNRKNSESLVIEGLYHDVLSLPNVQKKVLQFLKDHTNVQAPR